IGPGYRRSPTKRCPPLRNTLRGAAVDPAPCRAATAGDGRVEGSGETTIEPAHEALLRQWGLLQGWLVEDAGFLTVLDGIQRASRDWVSNGKRSSWLAHGEDRLRAAERLLTRHDLAAKLEPTDKDYIYACQSAEKAAVAEEAGRRSEEAERERAFQAAQLEAARAREQAARRLARRTMAGLLTALVLALTAIAAGWMAYVKQGEAERNA